MNQFGWLWLIHELTSSPLYLGYLGVAQSVPAISLITFGGAIADKVDRRRLIVLTQTLMTSMFLFLAIITVLEIVRPWHIIAIAAVVSTINAFDWPARESFYPRLVDRRSMMSAVALDSTTNTGVRVLMPGVAGLMVVALGTSSAFFISAAGYGTMAFFVFRIDPPRQEVRRASNPVRDVAEGVRFVLSRSIFSFLIFMTFFISLFGGSYNMLMPVFAVDVLDVGAGGQGMLMSAAGVGGVLVTFWLGAQSETKRRGLMTIGGVALFGLAVATFGLTSELVGSYPLALGLMFAIGASQVTYMVAISSSIQLMVPDELRGRVMGIHAVTYLLAPLGGMQAGAIASLLGAPYAVFIGGLAVVAFALGPALLNRNVRNLSSVIREGQEEGPDESVPRLRKV